MSIENQPKHYNKIYAFEDVHKSSAYRVTTQRRATIHTCTHTYGQFRVSSFLEVRLWTEEAEVPEVKPHWHIEHVKSNG